MRFKKEYDTFKCGHALATTRETWDTCNSVWEKRLLDIRMNHLRMSTGKSVDIVNFIDKFLEDSK